MQLRNHRLMSYRGIPNWPPAWVWIGVGENQYLQGEIGCLQRVTLSTDPPRIFLVTEHEGAEYIGCLLFDDRVFCLQICHLLEDHRGYPLQRIGELDLSRTL
jgi:hypothetical protein